MVTKFSARKATVAYATGAITWDASTEAPDETFTANVSEVKNFTLTPPTLEAETVLCTGSTAQTIGANHRTTGTATGPIAATFQNAAQVIKSNGEWKATGTLILTGDEQGIDVLGLDSGTAINAVAHRYAVGNIASNDWAANKLGSLRFYWNNGSEEVTAIMTNVIIKLGDIKGGGDVGHYERDFEAVCLAKNGALEWLD